MLERLDVKFFRGISALSLPDLGRINILIGQNGVGKTTVLEAVSAVANLHPEQFLRLAKWREFHSPTVDVLQSIFYQLDTNRSPEFIFFLNGQEHRLSVEPLSPLDVGKVSRISDTTENGFESHIGHNETFLGIKNIYVSPTGEKGETSLWAGEQPLEFQYEQTKFFPSLGCFFIHGRRATSIRETAEALTKIAESVDDERLFLDTLRSIDPRIKRIRAGVRGANPTVLVDVGLERMLPLNLLGDGFCRVTLMLTGIMGSDFKLVVIDEIDSGLHHSVMGDFWTHCITLTKQFDIQLFCTTHNEEILETAIDAFSDNPELLKIYRLEQRTADEVYVEQFDYSLLRNADLAGFEIR